VRELKAAIDQPGLKVVLFFTSPAYDLALLARELEGAFRCPIVGCTSAGQIGEQGYVRGGITAASISSEELDVRPYLIEPLSEHRERAAEAAARAQASLEHMTPGRRAFGLLLTDGLSLAEEGLAAALYRCLGDVPLFGGSAGDDLQFRRTHVYWAGTFRSGAAVLALFETSLRFAPLKLQHFRPTSRKVVVTAADPAARLVREIDGLPANQAYAAAIGVAAGQLSPSVFSANPLMLLIGGEHYVRSVYQANADGSLTLFCAIDEGLVLSIGEGIDPVAALDQGLQEALGAFSIPAITIGCDCILRRIELEQHGLDGGAGAVLARHGVVGFSTYGEQFNAVHVNQTFTGMVLGE
jgi:hypothetical protein